MGAALTKKWNRLLFSNYFYVKDRIKSCIHSYLLPESSLLMKLLIMSSSKDSDIWQLCPSQLKHNRGPLCSGVCSWSSSLYTQNLECNESSQRRQTVYLLPTPWLPKQLLRTCTEQAKSLGQYCGCLPVAPQDCSVTSGEQACGIQV